MNSQVLPLSQTILTSGAGLLVFVLAFYALAARERKTPYILESLYSACTIIIFSMFVEFVAIAVRLKWPESAGFIDLGALTILTASFAQVGYRIMKIHNRHINFRDDRLIGNTRIWRTLKDIKLRITDKATYEHTPLEIPAPLVQEINQILQFQSETSVAPRSVVILASSMQKVDPILSQLAVAFTKSDCWVQYMAFSRHPVEFFSFLKESHEDFTNILKQLVIVDAFTPHFGFTDSTCKQHTRTISRQNRVIPCASSYAGAHTASAAAFNEIKKRAKGANKPLRHATLVVYECARALVDLESVEQYQVFVRHVMPTERLWGGMLTVFVEVEPIGDDGVALLKSHADCVLDLREVDPRETTVADQSLQADTTAMALTPRVTV